MGNGNAQLQRVAEKERETKGDDKAVNMSVQTSYARSKRSTLSDALSNGYCYEQEAEPICRAVVEMRTKVLGEKHSQVKSSYSEVDCLGSVQSYSRRISPSAHVAQHSFKLFLKLNG